MAALAAGPVGCAPEGLSVVDATFSDQHTLTLTFSAALAPVEAADAAAFRLGLARSGPIDGFSSTQYYDPGAVGLVEDCYEECHFDDVKQHDVCEQTCPGTPGEIAVVGIEPDGTRRLALALSHAIGKPQCEWIQASEDEDWEAGFSVHYDAERGAVRSRRGDELGSFMALWVETGADFLEVDDRFPGHPGEATIAIPCPE
jgi:hypothetical protein